MPQHRDTQYLLDRAAIYDVLARYFQGLDRCNPGQVQSCFTEDVQAHYDERSSVRGIDALMSSLRTFKRMEKGEMKLTTHFMGNLSISLLEGGIAQTETNAIAFLIQPGEPTDQVAIRGLRYLDRLRREEGSWRISERRHTLDWSFAAPATFAATMAQRITTPPTRSS